jgi:hypothetical protein
MVFRPFECLRRLRGSSVGRAEFCLWRRRIRDAAARSPREKFLFREMLHGLFERPVGIFVETGSNDREDLRQASGSARSKPGSASVTSSPTSRIGPFFAGARQAHQCLDRKGLHYGTDWTGRAAAAIWGDVGSPRLIGVWRRPNTCSLSNPKPVLSQSKKSRGCVVPLRAPRASETHRSAGHGAKLSYSAGSNQPGHHPWVRAAISVDLPEEGRNED